MQPYNEVFMRRVAYRIRDRNPNSPTFGHVFGYGKRAAQLIRNPQTFGFELYDERVQKLARYLPDKLADILVVGGGFGYLEDALRRAGYRGRLATMDHDTWIERGMPIEGVSRDFMNRNIAGNITDLTDAFDVVITEHMIFAVSRHQRETVYANLDAITRDKVIHVIPRGYARLNKRYYDHQPRNHWQRETVKHFTHIWIEA